MTATDGFKGWEHCETAQQLYEFAHGTVAYNLPAWATMRLARTARNGAATVYVFIDGSRFTQYRDYYRRAWRSADGSKGQLTGGVR